MEHRVTVRLQPGPVRPQRRQKVDFTDSPGVRRDIMRRTDNVANYQRRAVPPGRLQATIRSQVSSHRGRFAGLAAAGRAGVTPYLGFYHDGTRPHPIRPSRARALRFVAGGTVVFARSVNHPGYRGNPFVRESVRAARP